jgi:hypothetical protein
MNNIKYYEDEVCPDMENLIELPNLNNSFSCLIEENKNDKENKIQVKNLYSNEDISSKYNYLLNKLL